jgi:hypothetical protein
MWKTSDRIPQRIVMSLSINEAAFRGLPEYICIRER